MATIGRTPKQTQTMGVPFAKGTVHQLDTIKAALNDPPQKPDSDSTIAACLSSFVAIAKTVQSVFAGGQFKLDPVDAVIDAVALMVAAAIMWHAIARYNAMKKRKHPLQELAITYVENFEEQARIKVESEPGAAAMNKQVRIGAPPVVATIEDEAAAESEADAEAEAADDETVTRG